MNQIRSLISTRFNWWTNALCFCLGRAFVKLFATITAVGIQLILIRSSCTSWRSQWWCMSMCRSFIESCGPSFVNSWIVYRLSQQIICLSSKDIPISLKKQLHQINFVPAYDKGISFASVLDFITNIYLVKCKLITPPNRTNRYPSVLHLLIKSSLNIASLAPAKTWLPTFCFEYLIIKVFIWYR